MKGLCYTVDGRLLSCSTDKLIKLWDLESKEVQPKSNSFANVKPVQTYVGTQGYNAIDHHRNDAIFATSSSVIDIWDEHRTQPTATLSWGVDTINAVKFNQTDTSVLASAGTDRALILYDLRMTTPISKLVTELRTNALSWNPMEAFNFAAASEDHNIYIYDMRKLTRALNVMKDHVSAVLDVDFSPTGEELVTGSYDRSIRIFRTREGRSREIYHTKRMQRFPIICRIWLTCKACSQSSSAWMQSISCLVVTMGMFDYGGQMPLIEPSFDPPVNNRNSITKNTSKNSSSICQRYDA